jgi:phage-related minor tail protein
MTILQRLNELEEKRRRSDHFRLSPSEQQAYDALVKQRRARVKEMIEEGRVVESGTSQSLIIKRRESSQRVMEYQESKEEND